MKRYLTKKTIIISIISLLLVLVILFIFFNPFLYFKVNSSKEIFIDVNTEFNKPTVKAYFFGNNITSLMSEKGKVNTSKIGLYKIKYKVKYIFTTKTVIIKVNVVDRELPSIKLVGNIDEKICPNTKYNEEGYSATDNYDGDITKNVIVSNKDNYIEYSVNDSSNNKFSIKRKINYIDEEIPVIKLIGSSNSKLLVNTSFKDLGYSVTDNCDGDITSNVEVINNLDTSKVGKYDIVYKIKDSSGNEATAKRTIEVVEKVYSNDYIDIVSGPTYINRILIVNKKYSLPSSFGNGVDNTAYNALLSLQNSASLVGYSMPLLSGYRSYYTQKTLYNNYVARDGVTLADTYSARPGHSEHQTGLAFDVGEISNYYGDTEAGIWLKNNAHLYGFIIRYPKGKENITGYQYEPWHIRYVGVNHATQIYNNSLTLEEYLGV